jgi:predicted Zn-dependent peptidase
MMRLAKNEYVFGRYVSYEEIIKNLNRVKVEDVIGLARECFRTNEISCAILGPIDPDKVEMGHLEFE